jgi:hypothetical protein
MLGVSWTGSPHYRFMNKKVISEYMSFLGKKSARSIKRKFATDREKKEFYREKANRRWNSPEQIKLRREKEAIRALELEARFAEAPHP